MSIKASIKLVKLVGLDEISGVNKIVKTKKVVFSVFASVVQILREQRQNY